MDKYNIYIKQNHLLPAILISGLIGIVISLINNSLLIFGIIISLPFLFTLITSIVKRPIILFYTLFIINYYIMGTTRYMNISGISVIMDVLLILIVLLIIIHAALLNNIEWKRAFNILTLGSLIWMIYTSIEIINPTGLFEGWYLSRGLVFNGFIITIIVSLLCNRYQIVKTLTLIFSILVLTAIFKALMQKFLGFDTGERKWLNNGGALTHIIGTGTRYFSFFTDAGNFGSNMGYAFILFGITALYTKNVAYKIYFAIISILSMYAMLLSGTRGAMIVPLGGLLLYTIICKNIKAMAFGGVCLLFIYVFFAFTMIGQGNQQIRRMRTAFRPSEDASFNVRKENQKKLGLYLKTKPFGEGLGLSGVENQKLSKRLTTAIPHDSWYVKVWVETGIVGITLHLAMIFGAIARGAWILMFKIKDTELKGRLTGYLCGIFGMFLSAYGNAFWGQYPTYIIAFTGITFVLCGEYFDKEIENDKNLSKNKNII